MLGAMAASTPRTADKLKPARRAAEDPRVDAYIAAARPFARPILLHLRQQVHRACPAATEDIKWGFPHFLHAGILCSMAAFNEHCTFGFWKHALLKSPAGRSGMDHFGRIASMDDLPDAAELRALIAEAARLNESGVARPPRKPRPALSTPAWLAAALRQHPRGAAAFKAFSPSHRNEYIEWLSEAKTEATRQRRLAQALTWIAAGKKRNWQYERPRRA